MVVWCVGRVMMGTVLSIHVAIHLYVPLLYCDVMCVCVCVCVCVQGGVDPVVPSAPAI